MFKIGDKVVCVAQTSWYNDETMDINPNAPKYNEILKIDFMDNDGFLGFNKYGTDTWEPSGFRKLDDTFATETLEKIKEEIEQEELVCL